MYRIYAPFTVLAAVICGVVSAHGEIVCSMHEAPENLARNARIASDSEYSDAYAAAHVANGVIPDAGSHDDSGRVWAVSGATHRQAATLTMTWAEPVSIGEIVYYGRTAFESAECWKGYEVFFDGADAPTQRGEFAVGHGPQRIVVEPSVTALSLTLRFTSSYGGSNPGAAEIQVYSAPVPADALPPFYDLSVVADPLAIAPVPPDDSPETIHLLGQRFGITRLALIQRHELNPSHVYTYHNEGFRAGGGLYVYDLPADALTQLVDASEGQILDGDVSYDGTRILFSWRRTPAVGYHLFTVDLDGGNLTQLTEGPWHDFNGCWLPDGGIAFLSTRDARFAYCWNSPVATLHRMNADGTDARRLSPNLVNDFTPSVMEDGRILYSRWEYVDKPAIPIQSLWTIRPDGTGLAGYYGNRVLNPATFMEARAIPGTTRVLAVFTAHNGPPRGALGIIDRSLGVNAAEAMRNVTPEVFIGPHEQGDGNHVRGPYESPWPLDSEWFLASHRGSILFRTYDGDRSARVIGRKDGMGFYTPRPAHVRARPPALPSSLPDGEDVPMHAAVFVQDVYEGLTPEVRRGEVKRIAVVQELEKRVRVSPEQRAFGFQFPVISGGATYAAKKVWGFADVAEDGSARFLVPAGVPVYFMALDSEGRAVQRMRTFTHFMPGEVQSCVGCHESRSHTSQPTARPDALRSAAAPLMPPEWGVDDGFDYSAVVQPVLDRHCVSCHGGFRPAAGLDLSGDKTDYFNVSYETLARENQGETGSPFVNWIPTYNGHEANILEIAPRAWGSPRSRLADIILSGHRDDDGDVRVRMSQEDKQRILTWIDLNVPYYGTAETAHPEREGARRLYPDRLDETLRDVAARRCAECHEHGNIPRREWTRITRPERNLFLMAPLARDAGGLESCGQPVFASPDDRDYRAILDTFEPIRDIMRQRPRMDMPDAEPAADVDRDRKALAAH